MIYFDNAATGGFKPRSVTDTTENVIRYLASNPGRSGHRLSVTGANIVYDTRKMLADFFNASPERVIFTKNCTEALNIAILGSVKKGGHIITTYLEHNSVLRPLNHLQEKGEITYTAICPKTTDFVHAIERAINEKTYMICCTSVSNVTGEALPIDEISKIAIKHNLLLIVDGAQGGGHIPLCVNKGVSILAVAGHKGLYGIMGSGAVILADNVDVEPIFFGGTGTESFNMFQPTVYPERLECGTVNLPAIAGLFEGVRYVKNYMSSFSETLLRFTTNLVSGLESIKNVEVVSKPNKSGIVSFKIATLTSMDVADILNREYDIAVRGGLQCAPLVHKFLKTTDCGLVRASLSTQNSEREIDFFIKSISRISSMYS